MKLIKVITALFLTTLATSAIATEGYSFAPSTDKLYVATAGEVILTFLSKEADYSNELYLQGKQDSILNNQNVTSGTQFSLGSFAAGTELAFTMFVKNTGFAFYTGEADKNPDNFMHAAFENKSGQPLTIGFEDLFNGGDRDYNDLVFSLTNVSLGTIPSPVPEPETYAMLAAGLLLLRAAKRRKA